MRRIAILGSTGSIGTQALDVARLHPELISVESLACFGKIDLMEKQIREFAPARAAVFDEALASDLKVRVADTRTKVYSGMDGLIELAGGGEADTVLTALVGMIGIKPTVAALQAGRDIALANKETCVAAGHIIMPLAKEKGSAILPVDSEHSAIFQALLGRGGSEVGKIILTASGGPFRGRKREELAAVTPSEALAHPTWTMGPKITIDSATLVNKGLEVIEARWLFDVMPERIQVVVHPQSLIHSAVEYEDGSVIAQIGPSDMRIPIQFALTYPDHIPSPAEHVDFYTLRQVTFEEPDTETFKGLPLAYSAIGRGGNMPCVYNAANEWANDAFRRGKLGFLEIYDVIGEAMAGMRFEADPSLEEIFAAEEEVINFCGEKYGKG